MNGRITMPEFVGRTLPIDMQLLNEETYSKARVDRLIEEEVLGDPAVQERVQMGVNLINEWLTGEYYESKQNRLNQLKSMNIQRIVEQIFVVSAYSQAPDLFTSVTGMVASRLKFADKADSIKTVAELMAVLLPTGVYQLTKNDTYSSIYVKSNFMLSEVVIKDYQRSQYLPPVVCEPKQLKSNKDSIYSTKRGSLILGSGNHHDGDICLDVLNSKNKTPLCLDTDFLSTYEEVPKKPLDDPEKVRNWNDFKLHSYRFYALIANQGNKFYLENEVDFRGREYVHGYHITTQGTSFKKASIEFYDKEVIEGVDDFLNSLEAA
jgi:hypothetical protein